MRLRKRKRLAAQAASKAVTTGTAPESSHPLRQIPSSVGAVSGDYLRQVVEQGGATISHYKTRSYELLQLERSLCVLDVGCGPGLDLIPLAERVGPEGLVIGVDPDRQLLWEAEQVKGGRENIRLVEGTAEHLPFPEAMFDRVRTDRVLQHLPQPEQALAEFWRVLRPGGVLTLIEPDWKMVALYPGSPGGGDDDGTLEALLTYNQRQSVHPLMGRQLYSLLRRQSAAAWDSVQVEVEALIHTSWPVVDRLLMLSSLARDLVHEMPTRAAEIGAWLKAIESAATRGEFLASMQIFLVRACKGPIR